MNDKLKKQISRNTIHHYGDKVLTKAMRMALDGNTAMIKYVLDRYFADKITLKGKSTKQLVKSLIKESLKPGVTKDEIDSAVKIIRVHMDASELKEIQDRLEKLEQS